MRKKNKFKKYGMKIYKPKTIEEAIDNIQVFFECDMWYACRTEWKTEEKMIKYLGAHFDILRKEIKCIKTK